MINISKVKQLMKEKGLKVQYVCDKLGASRYKMYDWERGKSTPSENEMEVLASILSTTVDYLTDKTDIKEQKNKPLTEVKGLSPEAINLAKRIEELSPANRAKLQELIGLYLSAQDKNK